MRRMLIILLPFAVLALGMTYAAFSSTLYIGKYERPNIVQTGTLEWNLYLPSELGYPWNLLPDIIDGVWNPNVNPHLVIPETPDIANATIEKSGDTVSITLTNVYPGYGAVAHFIYKNEGTIPSKLRDASITIDDPDGVADNIVTAILLVYSPNGNRPYGIKLIGFNLTVLPSLIEQKLNGIVFTKGGFILFCKPNETNVTIKDVIVNPNSGLPQDMLDALNDTDSFWIIVPPNSTPPQNSWLKFNLTLTFGQFNE